MSEVIVLDPVEVAGTARTSLEITPWIDQDGLDYGDGEIQAFMAEQSRGESPVDYRIPNRSIQGGLIFKDRGGTTADTARQKVQAKIALMQREGGWIKRITASGSIVYADVVNATLHATSVSGLESRGSFETNASLSLECIPDFYGDEVTLSDHVETTLPELTFTETNIAGDYPGRVRIVVDEDEGQDQRGLIWAFRSRHYSSASTAASAYQAEALQALDTARILALSGASGGTAVTHGTISTSWTPVVGTNIGGTSYLTHEGSYRLYARVYSTNGTTVQTRATWDVGDLVNPAENSVTRLPGASNFYIVDYGELRLDPAPVGTHRWQGQIQAKGDVGTENFSVDRVWIVNTDESMGVLTAGNGVSYAALLARDEFNQSAGTLTGKALTVGGNWTAGSATGAGADWSIDTSGHTAQRTAVSETGARFALGGTATYTATTVACDIQQSVGATNTQWGIVVRYVDTSNYAVLFANSSTSLQLIVVKAGVASSAWFQPFSFTPNRFFTLILDVSAAGLCRGWVVPTGSSLGEPLLTGYDSNLATGGTLASGQAGLYEKWAVATPSTRTYDNFLLTSATSDMALYASRAAQLTTQGQFRQDSSGTAYGPISNVRGDLPRIPSSGLEGRTVEGFIKASRGDFDTQPDSGIDNLSARAYYRPSYLFVP